MELFLIVNLNWLKFYSFSFLRKVEFEPNRKNEDEGKFWLLVIVLKQTYFAKFCMIYMYILLNYNSKSIHIKNDTTWHKNHKIPNQLSNLNPTKQHNNNY